MSEADFITRESAKHKKRLARQLRQVERCGFAAGRVIELLLVNGLITFSPPRLGFPFNHYKLTEAGVERIHLR